MNLWDTEDTEDTENTRGEGEESFGGVCTSDPVIFLLFLVLSVGSVLSVSQVSGQFWMMTDSDQSELRSFCRSFADVFGAVGEPLFSLCLRVSNSEN